MRCSQGRLSARRAAVPGVLRRLLPAADTMPIRDSAEARGTLQPFQRHLMQGQPCCRSILVAERVALNFLQRMSGIASLTRQMVDAVQVGMGRPRCRQLVAKAQPARC